ncbi:hypothetical protein [Martelella soudanensis]|uniref:hypothetical protein n=1 Tax=unclassified Martelella TaxID=2629616 RepID=UPI0015DF7CB0|nr:MULTISPECIES: hypothetical protein [unclassified Martelella]
MSNENTKSVLKTDEAEIEELSPAELQDAAGGSFLGSALSDVEDGVKAAGHVAGEVVEFGAEVEWDILKSGGS